jgi:glycosyltransferase involved in cell wall biosynthesis
MINNPVVFIVVPVYNDAKTIASVVHELRDAGYDNIIVVDDGSEADIFGEISGLNLFYLRHSVNLGQGAALQTGFEYALKRGADVIVSFDADGQHCAADLEGIVGPVLRGEADVVLGSRFLRRAASGIPIMRVGVLQMARVANFLLSGIWLSDAHNGLRAFSRKAVGKLEITENGMAHASELLFEIKKHRLRYVEVPVTINYTPYSVNKGQSNRGGVKVLFDILIHKIFR